MLNRNDFLDDIAFERALLRDVVASRPSQPPEAPIDLRGNQVRVGGALVDRIAAGDSGQAQRPMASSTFSTAWKIFDVLIEHVMRQARGFAATRRILIQEKKSFAQTPADRGLLAADLHDSAIADRVAYVYGATVELRRALIHRSVSFEHAVLSDGTHAIGEEQIDAMARLALGCIGVIDAGGMDQRTRADLAHWANLLGALHNLQPIDGADPMRPLPLIIVDATRDGAATWSVDTQRALTAARQRLPSFRWFDVEVHFPGTELPPLSGHLDAAPEGSAVAADPMVALGWIRL